MRQSISPHIDTHLAPLFSEYLFQSVVNRCTDLDTTIVALCCVESIKPYLSHSMGLDVRIATWGNHSQVVSGHGPGGSNSLADELCTR